MKKLSRLLIIPKIVSIMFNCKKNESKPQAETYKKTKICVNTITTKVGIKITLTADVNKSETTMIRWFFRENSFLDRKTLNTA